MIFIRSNRIGKLTEPYREGMSAPETAATEPPVQNAPAASSGGGEPPFVVPHHMSDIDFWKFPDRNYYVFICLSFMFGFVGADHFYLRSFNTAMQKAFVNVFTFGMWWIWDLIQIVYDGRKVREEGLTSPFDWIRGIGRGVFEDPIKKGQEAKDKDAPVVRTKKDIVVYALAALVFGIFGLDRFYVGQTWVGIAKFISCWNILTFLLGWMWATWDAAHVVLYPETIVKGELRVPMPFNLIFPMGISGEPLFIPQKVTPQELAQEVKEEKAAAAAPVSLIGGLPLTVEGVLTNDTFRLMYRELGVPLLQPSAGTTIAKVDQGIKLTTTAAAVGSEVAESVPKIAGAVTSQIAAVTDPNKLMGQIQAAAAAKAAERVPGVGTMVGGGGLGGGASGTGGPVIAGTLAAITLAGAAKVIIELLSHKK
jgi:TM2 domain-containing membrane protein YozV